MITKHSSDDKHTPEPLNTSVETNPGNPRNSVEADADPAKTMDRKNRRYQVSTNRHAATHKLRYLESGGGEADGECRLCKPALEPKLESKLKPKLGQKLK